MHAFDQSWLQTFQRDSEKSNSAFSTTLTPEKRIRKKLIVGNRDVLQPSQAGSSMLILRGILSKAAAAQKVHFSTGNRRDVLRDRGVSLESRP